jgi:hypothetical protein
MTHNIGELTKNLHPLSLFPTSLMDSACGISFLQTAREEEREARIHETPKMPPTFHFFLRIPLNDAKIEEAISWIDICSAIQVGLV